MQDLPPLLYGFLAAGSADHLSVFPLGFPYLSPSYGGIRTIPQPLKTKIQVSSSAGLDLHVQNIHEHGVFCILLYDASNKTQRSSFV